MKLKNKEKWIFKDMKWDEFISHPFLKIYNLDKLPCAVNSCKKNCTDNLFCLNKLGEGRWINGTEDDNCDQRNENTSETNFAAGLKNYGNTCYFNSLLQVYFNIIRLREGIFRFPTEDIPDEIINYLQTIFAQMQLSIHKSVDPVELINALELPQLEQQDAPEFHSLFLNLLDERLSLIEDPVIKQLFDGTIGYITRCRGCNYTSTVTCLFREIDLKPMFAFDETLNDFLKVELLTGDNKYDCSSCGQKCDGERQTVLLQLPSILCFQFLRYSYDNSGIKKKNCSNVTFPNNLSMQNYIDSENEAEYIIKAILIHIGSQPSSGHYQTLIRTSNEEWILYDDLNVKKLDSIEDVKKILDKKKLGQTKSETDAIKKDGKEIKENDKFISSNAYMVFYERQELFKDDCGLNTEIDVPCHLKEHINLINQSYLADLENQQRKQEEDRIEFIENSKLICDAYNQLPITAREIDLLSNSNEVEFMPTEWIQNWLELGKKISQSNQWQKSCENDIEQWKPLLCIHGGLGPDIPLNKLKIVNSTGVDSLIDCDFLISKYRRRRLNDICRNCWRLKFEIKKFEGNSKTEVEIDNCEKLSDGNETSHQEYFWISKNHLRHWRKIIRSSIESKYNDDQDALDNGSRSEGSSTKGTQTILNSDLLCSHHKLSIDKSKRVLIPKKVWLKLLGYFPDRTGELYFEFPYKHNFDMEGCSDCSKELLDLVQKCEIEKLNLTKLVNTKRKFDYNFVNKTICNSTMSINELEIFEEKTVLYLIPSSFIISWKKFIKLPSIDTLIRKVDYSEVFCEHGKYFEKEWYELINDETFFVLFESEWNKFLSYYPELNFEHISLITDKSFSEIPKLVSSISLCEICCKEWNETRSNFENCEIYIRLITDGGEDLNELPEEPLKKRAKTDKVESTPKTIRTKEIDINLLRRSTRSKRQRNDTSIRINSKDTIRDIKVKIMQIYKVSPIDQHLIFNSTELIDSKATISDVGIKPSSILHLILDTTPINNLDYNSTGLETGFTGTKLMESFR